MYYCDPPKASDVLNRIVGRFVGSQLAGMCDGSSFKHHFIRFRDATRLLVYLNR